MNKKVAAVSLFKRVRKYTNAMNNVQTFLLQKFHWYQPKYPKKYEQKM
jgi:hypothetical protein